MCVKCLSARGTSRFVGRTSATLKNSLAAIENEYLH